MNLTANAKFDREKGTITVDLVLVGHTEIEHEMLAAFFSKPLPVTIAPKHHGDVLKAEFTITDPAAFDAAIHNLENRKRKADGRPSLEEEAERAKAAGEAPPPKPHQKAKFKQPEPFAPERVAHSEQPEGDDPDAKESKKKKVQ
jgi:hypothetical protein